MTEERWFERFVDGFGRLKGPDEEPIPTLEVVRLLGLVEEDELIDEHERSMARSWRERLVDDEGNPLGLDGDRIVGVIEDAAEHNGLNTNGSVSSLFTYPDGSVEFRIRLHPRVADRPRDEIRAKLVPHAETYVDHALDKVYAQPATEDAGKPAIGAGSSGPS